MKLHFILMLLIVGSLKAQTIPEQRTNQRFIFATSAGFAYRTAPLSDDIFEAHKDYVKNFKTGYNIGAELSYFIKPQWGLGAKFIHFNSINTVYLNGSSGDGTPTSREKVKDKISINYIGPAFFSRIPFSNDRHIVLGSLGIGYLSYNGISNLTNQPLKTSGGTFGSSLDIGYDYRLVKSLYVGVQLGYTVGVLDKVKISQGSNTTNLILEGDDKEGLSFLNIGGGLRLSF